MSGTLPVDPGLQGLTINSNFSVIRNTSISGLVTTTRLPGHFWSFSVNYPNMTRAEAGAINAFVNSQEGFDTFQFTPTKYKDAGGAATERKNTLSGTIVTDLDIDIAKTTGTSTGITFTSAFTSSYYNYATHGYFLQAGDFIKFTGHNKVYQVTNNVTLASDGSGSINITPRLQAAVAQAENIIYTNVPWTVITSDITTVMEAGVGDVHSMAFDLREKP